MKLLDLSKFEKVAEDKNTATMKHADGHKMIIMLAALPKIQREQLKRIKMASGGGVQHFDTGTTESNPIASASDDSQGSDSSSSQSDDLSNAKQNAAIADRDAAPAASPATNITINAAPAAPAAPASTSAAAQPMAGTTPVTYNPAVQMGQDSGQMNVPAPVQPEPNLNPNGTMNPGAVARNTQLANQGEQQVNAAKAEAMAANEQEYIDQARDVAGQRQRYLNDITGHVNALNQYGQNNPIDPKHYQENMSSGAKVASGLGLLLGGFSAGHSGTGVNPAMDFLNKQIDRDIQGQKDRMDQQKTIYGAYHQLYGDSVATNNATKASMIDIYNHRANQIAAQLGTPQAAANAAALGAQGAAEKSKLLQDAAVDLRSLPGFSRTGATGSALPQSGTSGQGGHPTSSPYTSPSSRATSGSLLKPEAAQKYAWSMSKYNKTQTPVESGKIQKEYEDAQQADKSVSAIEQLWPQMMQHRTFSGYVGDVAGPGEGVIAGGALGAGAGALLGDGVGAIPGAKYGAIAGGALGEGIHALGKHLGGDDQIKYETARNALVTQVGSALGDGVTPSEKAQIAHDFAPNWWDSDASAKDKLEKLKAKIKLVTRTPTLDSMKLTNR